MQREVSFLSENDGGIVKKILYKTIFQSAIPPVQLTHALGTVGLFLKKETQKLLKWFYRQAEITHNVIYAK